jgi:hypothetical protein
MPENIRNELLIKLANNESAAEDVAYPVAYTVAENFATLPKNVQILLSKLADNKDAAGDVNRAVTENFDKLPENIRNELLKKLEQ